ncbi:centromere protein C-like isoform X2 [Haliotis rufescens]|uniref:centromere protein C-like isoform X2 n=1 Tax=Haliotis rufescens TaxID=6454 RepID=UPI00201F0A35|nr:centromere protein C-like isoform X2 [Haliotis rufescens]
MKAKPSARAKKLKGQNEVFLQSLVNRNIGSRTGKDVKAGKLIEKDEDGFDNFDAYWSESDADVTNNTTLHSKLSSVSGRTEKENQAQTTLGRTSTLQSVDTCTSLRVGGTGTYYLGNRVIGSRTGKNIKAGKNIRKCDDGIENFDDYWSESEADSILSFHKSIRTNDTRSFLAAGTPQERDENISSVTGEDGSEGEVVINSRHRYAGTGWENSDLGQGADNEGDVWGTGGRHPMEDSTELVEDNLHDSAEEQRCCDTGSVQGTYTHRQHPSNLKQAHDVPEDSTVWSESEQSVVEDAESLPESTGEYSQSTEGVPLEQSSQSTCSESVQDDDVTGTVLKRPDTLSRSQLSHMKGELPAHREEKHVTTEVASIQLESFQKSTMDDRTADSSSQLTETETSQGQQSANLSSTGKYSKKKGKPRNKPTLNRSRCGKTSLGEESNASISEDVTGRLSTRRTRSQSKQSLGATEDRPPEASSNKGRKRQNKSLSNSGDVAVDAEIGPPEASSSKGRKRQNKRLSNSGDVAVDAEIGPLEASSNKGRKQQNKSLSNSWDVTIDAEVGPLEASSNKGRKQQNKSLSNSRDVAVNAEIGTLEASSNKGRKRQNKSLSNSGDVTVEQTHTETAVKVNSHRRNSRSKKKVYVSDKSSCSDINASAEKSLIRMSNKKENKKSMNKVKTANCSDHEENMTKRMTDEVMKAGLDATESNQAELEAGLDATESNQAELEAGLDATESNQAELEAGLDTTESNQAALEADSDATESNQAALEAGLDATESNQAALEAGLDATESNQAALEAGFDATVNKITDDKILKKAEQSSEESVLETTDHEINNSSVNKISSNNGRSKTASERLSVDEELEQKVNAEECRAVTHVKLKSVKSTRSVKTSGVENISQTLSAIYTDKKQDESNARTHSANQDSDESGMTGTAPDLSKDDAPPSEHFDTPGDLPRVNKQAGCLHGGDTTPADLNEQGRGQKSVNAAGLDIGGDVTGSISKNTNATVSIIPSHTPMLSFRTKKRLSYSKLLNDSLERRSQTETSASLPAMSGLTQPPSLESVVEEEGDGDHGDKDNPNADFLCLRPASLNRSATLRQQEELNSAEDEFWMVEDKPLKKKKPVKKSTSPRKSVKQNRNSAEGVMEENTVKGKKKARQKTERLKKSARKDAASPVVSEADIVADDGESLLQHTLFTDTPTSCKPRKRKSPQPPAPNSGGKKSKPARVTKTMEIMKGTRKSVPAVANASVSRLSHLNLTVPGETPKSGVSFRQRRRTSIRDSEQSSMNLSCPEQFSPQSESKTTRIQTKKRNSSLKGKIVATSTSAKHLTPCLANSDVTSVQKKKRRVTISNIVEKASVSYSDSTGSDHELMIGHTPNCQISAPDWSDVTGSPVHIFEMTNTATPDPITAPPISKIIYPRPGPEGVRRSNRVRLRPIEWFKNEQVIYERRKSGNFVIAGVQPSKEAEYLAAEAEKQKKRRARMKRKETKSSKLSRNRLLAKANLSLHTDLSADKDYTVSTDFPIMNPETQQEVLVDCIAPVDSYLYVGPDGDPPCEGDPFIICHAIQQPAFTVGHLLIAPLGEKPTQVLRDNTLIFTIVHGKLSVTIHRGSTVLEAGDQFFVPRGNTYSLKNLRNEEAKLSFVNLIEDSSS